MLKLPAFKLPALKTVGLTILPTFAAAGIIFGLIVSAWNDHKQLQAQQPSAVDIGFSQAMAAHHQQALVMANILLDGQATGLHQLAQTIATQQAIELGQFQAWLSLWQAPYDYDPKMSWMLTSNATLDPSLLQYIARCTASPDRMPGNASAAELASLRQLSGRQRDELFMQLMLRHHEGALPMARFAARAAKLRPVSRLARQILLQQAKEIQQFKSMLALLRSAPESIEAGTKI